MSHALPEFSDKANDGGVNKILTIPGGGVAELVVGVDILEEREFVQFQALETGVKWGFSSGAGEQPFDCFKSQFFILPFGPGTSVFFLNTKGSPVTVAIGEIA